MLFLLNSKEVEVDLEMQAEILGVFVGRHRYVTEPVSPIELRVDIFVGREQKPEARAINGGRLR